MIYLMLSLAVLLFVLYLYVELNHKPLHAFAFKGLASLGFIGVFTVSVVSNNTFLNEPLIAALFLIGLVAGLMGDLYLALRPLRPKEENHSIILIGTLCFATGHVFYYSALLLNGPFSLWAPLISLIVTIATFMASKLMKLNWGPSKIPSLVYSFLLFLVASQAFINALNDGFTPYGLVVLIGAVLFALSDLILAQIYFGNNTKKSFIVANLSTYYLAQILLAFSLFLI